MLDYFPIVIAFAAVLVGIVGKTWNDQRSGWKRVTWLGWVTIAVGLASLLTSFALIRASHRRDDEVRRKAARAGAIAMLRIQGALNHLIHPLQRTITVYKGPESWAYLGDDQFDMQLERFVTADFQSNLSTIYFDQQPPNARAGGRTWEEEFRDSTTYALAEIDRQILIYGRYMPDEVLDALEEFRSEVYLWRIHNLAQLRISRRDPSRTASVAEVFDHFALEQFVRSLNALTSKLRAHYDPAIVPPRDVPSYTGKDSLADDAAAVTTTGGRSR